jgi:hypothetical protein
MKIFGSVYPVLAWFARILSSGEMKTLDSLRKDAVDLITRKSKPTWAER